MTTMSVFKRIVGPRAPATANEKERATYRLPNILLGVAALLLAVSMFMPYWEMTLKAPQYPAGLAIQAHVNRLTGDVSEIDGLNHYIGMRPLAEAAQLERAFPGLPNARWVALRLLDGDERIAAALRSVASAMSARRSGSRSPRSSV